MTTRYVYVVDYHGRPVRAFLTVDECKDFLAGLGDDWLDGYRVWRMPIADGLLPRYFTAKGFLHA